MHQGFFDPLESRGVLLQVRQVEHANIALLRYFVVKVIVGNIVAIVMVPIPGVFFDQVVGKINGNKPYRRTGIEVAGSLYNRADVLRVKTKIVAVPPVPFRPVLIIIQSIRIRSSARTTAYIKVGLDKKVRGYFLPFNLVALGLLNSFFNITHGFA